MSGKEPPPPAPAPMSARVRVRFEPEQTPNPASFFHRTFALETLRQATGNFSPDNLVGRGSSATVYRATLPDGSPVAVKRLNSDEGFDEKAWRAELAALAKARHRNLVPLLGVCSEGGERLLVLEFFAGGSLRERLAAGRARALTWEERMNVVEGVCRGLAYLHHDISPPLLHRNVKPANVLLRGSARGSRRASRTSAWRAWFATRTQATRRSCPQRPRTPQEGPSLCLPSVTCTALECSSWRY